MTVWMPPEWVRSGTEVPPAAPPSSHPPSSDPSADQSADHPSPAQASLDPPPAPPRGDEPDGEVAEPEDDRVTLWTPEAAADDRDDEPAAGKADGPEMTARADPDVVERIYRAMVQAYIDMELTEHHKAAPRQ